MTGRPDHHLEEFWLSFKDSIIPYIDHNRVREINEISEHLNGLKSSEQYQSIEKSIYTYLKQMIYYFITNNMYYQAKILKTNIKRWTRITVVHTGKPKPKTNKHTAILDIYLKVAHTSDEILKDLIFCYAYSPSHKYLVSIVNQSIRKEQTGIIEKLIPYIDIKAFVKPDSRYAKFNAQQLAQVKSRKLIKHLQPI